MSQQYRVRLTKDYLVFSAAHFITFAPGVCERLHGHNYRVTAEVSGELDAHHLVMDFILLRDELKKLVDELDHHVLLPTAHPQIRVEWDEREVRTSYEDRRWVFPRGDCILLPVANTTAELLARYLGQRLLESLEQRTGWRPGRLSVEVDECAGQSAVCELTGE